MRTNSIKNGFLSIPLNQTYTAGISNLANCKDVLTKVSNTLVIIQRKGFAKVRINFEEYFLEERSQVFMLANSTISVIESSEDFEVLYFGFRPTELIRNGMRIDINIFHFIKRNPCYQHNPEVYHIIYSLIDLIVKFYEEEANINKTRIISNLISILFLDMEDKLKKAIKQNDWLSQKTTRQEDIFRKFMQLVHNKCRKHKEVSYYANELCISPRYLATIIKNITGTKTAKQIIDENVIAEIKFLLQSGVPIKGIIAQINFPDQSFLGKYFKKHTGKTLVEFKK